MPVRYGLERDGIAAGGAPGVKDAPFAGVVESGCPVFCGDGDQKTAVAMLSKIGSTPVVTDAVATVSSGSSAGEGVRAISHSASSMAVMMPSWMLAAVM